MKLNWLFGSSMEAHHLLYAYLAVWLIQGGYAAWIAWQWMRAGKNLKPGLSLNSETDEDL
jgi:threonine/homoserine/homoserine lactone efflux protein